MPPRENVGYVFRNNAPKYSLRVMCLTMSTIRSTLYYHRPATERYPVVDATPSRFSTLHLYAPSSVSTTSHIVSRMMPFVWSSSSTCLSVARTSSSSLNHFTVGVGVARYCAMNVTVPPATTSSYGRSRCTNSGAVIVIPIDYSQRHILSNI